MTKTGDDASKTSWHKTRMDLQGPLLAIESSCDDCAAAIISPSGEILADVVLSQTATHARFGGIVPEHASRQHLATVSDVVAQALLQAGLRAQDIKAVAVTYGPGLIGSLIVGVQFARGFAGALGIPLLGIHHIEGHLFAAFSKPGFPRTPFVGLVVSGGHTALYLCDPQSTTINFLGDTRDDAAGEAFDKAAKMLGFGYPGGHLIDQHAKTGDVASFAFPIAMRSSDVPEYSFSGLKTSFRYKLQEIGSNNLDITTVSNLCASFQNAIVTSLLEKAFLACKQQGIHTLVIGGGVTCNSQLRKRAEIEGAKHNIKVFLTPKEHCTDNGVMIAQAALRRIRLGDVLMNNFSVKATSEIGHP